MSKFGILSNSQNELQMYFYNFIMDLTENVKSILNTHNSF